MMNRINEIWDNQINDQSFHSGILLRRYSADIIPTISVALTFLEKRRCIAISVSNTVDISTWNVLQDIRFELILDPKDATRFLLLLILLDQKHKDIFSILCEDLILEVADEKNEKQLIKRLLNRFIKWENLFDKANREGLTVDEQKGLFGELYFLKQLLEHNRNYLFCIESWTGPTAAARDFQYEDWAVEVKSTTATNPQKIKISNERQLDTTLIPNLFLVHYSFEALNNNGETLNGLIDSIGQLLITQPIAEQRFKHLLFEVGYFSHHQDLYSNTGYSLIQVKYFQVDEQFPRLIESTIPNGVSELKYSITIAACEPFLVTQKQLFESIKDKSQP